MKKLLLAVMMIFSVVFCFAEEYTVHNISGSGTVVLMRENHNYLLKVGDKVMSEDTVVISSGASVTLISKKGSEIKLYSTTTLKEFGL